MLSIQEFSKKTGVPKSALRFYEEKELLIPERNEENGYRVYQEEQIDLARLIASLRLANVPLKDIQKYVYATDSKQKIMKQEWVELLKQQKQLLELQIKYLESNQEDNQIFLFEKQAERVVWLFAGARQGGFAEYFLKGKKELEKNHITVHNYYLKHLSGRKNVKAWVGFGIDEFANVTNINLFNKEDKLSKSLCVATQYQGDFSKIEIAYRNLVRYVSDHDYIPTGSLMEVYQGNDLERVTILLPVMKLEGGE